MIIARQINKTINSMPQGRMFTIADFNIPKGYQPALVKAISRMVIKGDLGKVSKGRYYKPRQSPFGALKPPIEEFIKYFLESDGKVIGYITGTAAFASMGLTTQISSAITIATNKYRRPMKLEGYNVSFMFQPNNITEENIPLLRILDAIRLIRDIPATTPDESVLILCALIKALPKDKRKMLAALALNYTPYVRALLGAILEQTGANTFGLRDTLNGLTTYKLPVSTQALPNKSNWNIV